MLTYLFFALAAFGFVLGGGLAMFHLFGANPLWVVLPLLGGVCGYALCAVFPPPIVGILAQILQLLEELPSVVTATLKPQHKTSKIQESSPTVVFHPVPYAPSELFDGYVVSISEEVSTTNEHEQAYLRCWNYATRQLSFTSALDEAYTFSSLWHAFRLAQICYYCNNGRHEVSIRGIAIGSR